ncbi:hypothetical protein BTJ39_16920 [Izhakiella australiensis]|uniref:Flagellar hook-length control protein-like C-terminal domain-containing protein n=1 Tax=Izhakiella australiensis TaxID=1926881 RepID=A0A1S8YI80_9GAMM|nr:flagellar hook-length control protein FliK [Izhakiella australiensis]OON38770.1 hypothetical protein BTJ39_16920 [Izhakiella australiensis]
MIISSLVSQSLRQTSREALSVPPASPALMITSPTTAFSPVLPFALVDSSSNGSLKVNNERHPDNADAGSDEVLVDPAALLALLLPGVALPATNEVNAACAAGEAHSGESAAAMADGRLPNDDGDLTASIAADDALKAHSAAAMADGRLPNDDGDLTASVAASWGNTDNTDSSRSAADDALKAHSVAAWPDDHPQQDSDKPTTGDEVSVSHSASVIDSASVRPLPAADAALHAESFLPQSQERANPLIANHSASVSFPRPAASSDRFVSPQSILAPAVATATAVNSAVLSSEKQNSPIGDTDLHTFNRQPGEPAMTLAFSAPEKSVQAQSAITSMLHQSAINNPTQLAPTGAVINQAAIHISEQKIQLQPMLQSALNADGARTLQQTLGERLQMQIDGQMQKATIRLDPPELGKLDISLHYTTGKLQVQIHAAQPEVWRALNQAAPELRATLSDNNQLQVNVQVSQQGGKGRERYHQQHEEENIFANDGRSVTSPERDDRSVITRV